MRCERGKHAFLESEERQLGTSQTRLGIIPSIIIECVHRHAIKNKIKNYATDKVKKL